MEFKVFAKKLKSIIGGKSNNPQFTKTIFEAMMNESGPDLLEGTSVNTFKAYFNGNTSISKVSSLVLANLSDDDEFSSYIEGFGETTTKLLVDEFNDDIPGINSSNASFMITDLFLKILKEASGKDKSTVKSTNKSTNDIPSVSDEKQGSVNNSISKLDGNFNAKTTRIQLPEEQPGKSPYSIGDNHLLQEFIADYEEIMIILISENYTFSLIDMTLPCKIKDLYETKWISKANTFTNPLLKSYIFSLLGELNNISNNFWDDSSVTPVLGNARAKIRNLYVKLHPEQFQCTFPYDAFINDWNDGEY